MEEKYADYARRAVRYAQAGYAAYHGVRGLLGRSAGRKRKFSGPDRFGGRRKLNPPIVLRKPRGFQMVGGRSFNGGRKWRRKPYHGMTRRTKKYVKRMIQNAASDGVNTYRNCNSTQYSCGQNQCAYFGLGHATNSDLDLVLGNAIHQEDNAGVINEAVIDLTQAHKGKKVLIKNTHLKVCLRNNAQIPAYLEVFWFRCKNSTNNDPVNILSDAGDNKQVTAIGTDVRFNMYDAGSMMSHNWKMLKKRRYLLNGGDQVWVTTGNNRPFNFDYDKYADEALNFNKGYSTFIGFRLSGVVTHDNTDTQLVGLGPATLDVCYWLHYKYESTVDKNYHYAQEGVDFFDNMVNGPIAVGPDVEELDLEL